MHYNVGKKEVKFKKTQPNQLCVLFEAQSAVLLFALVCFNVHGTIFVCVLHMLQISRFRYELFLFKQHRQRIIFQIGCTYSHCGSESHCRKKREKRQLASAQIACVCAHFGETMLSGAYSPHTHQR